MGCAFFPTNGLGADVIAWVQFAFDKNQASLRAIIGAVERVGGCLEGEAVVAG